MKHKKKLWIPIVAAVLVVAAVAGILLMPRVPSEEVAVYAVNMVGYTDFYSGSTESYGMVTTDKVQTAYVSDTQTVTEILVYPGQEVKKGDVLYTYDTTLSDLAVERKDLSIQQMEVQLKTAQQELKELKAMKPMVITTKPTQTTSADTDYSKSPADKDKLNTVYSTKTSGKSSRSPFYFWLGRNAMVDETVIDDLFALAGGNVNTIYVVFQISRLDAPNSEFISQYGVSYTRVATSAPEEPTDPTNPSEPSDPSNPTDPTDPTNPGEPTDPTNPTDPTDPTQPAEPPESSEPTEPSVPDEPTDPSEPETPETPETPEDPDPSEPETPETPENPETPETPETPENPEQPEQPEQPTPTPVPEESRYSYSMRFFDPGNNPEEDDGGNANVDWNSGYTQAELTAMRNEKQAEINQLQFDIRMGKAELKIMQKEADSGQILAAFDGVVTDVLEPQDAMMLDMPMIKVTGGGGYYVEGTVSELDLNTIQVGQVVTINAWDTGEVLQGTVVEVGKYPTEDQGYYYYGSTNVSYYPYKVFIDQSANLQEGYYVSMTYQTQTNTEGTLYLQNAFIRKEGSRSYVYVCNAEGLLEKRYLEAGVSQDGYMTPIYSGLTDEDFVAFPYGNDIVEGAPTYEASMEELYGY